MLENHSQATQWTALALRLITAVAALALSLADRGGVLPSTDVLTIPLILIGVSNLAAAGAIMIPGLHNTRNMIQSAADWLTAGAAAALTYNTPLALLLLTVGIGGTGVNRWPWPWGCVVGSGVFAAVATGVALGHPEGVNALDDIWQYALVAGVALTVMWAWGWAEDKYGANSIRLFSQVIEQR